MGLRTFIAVELPAPVREALAQVCLQLAAAWAGGPVRWTPTDNLHLTLRFLGDTDEERIGPVRDLLDGIAAAAVPLELDLGVVGAFPNVRRPRVIWAGLEGEGREGLDLLQGRVEHGVRALGWEREGRAFHPHLTLGRVRQGAPEPPARWLRVRVPARQVPVRELVLVRSVLTPAGADYGCLHRVPLMT